MNIQLTIASAEGTHTSRDFNTEWDDPISEGLENFFANPHIRKPLKVIAVFDDGEVIVWSRHG